MDIIQRFLCITGILIFLLVIQIVTVRGQETHQTKKWTGSLSDGKLITENMLENIILNHEKWLYNNGGEKANLSGANLSGADLSGANLMNVDLTQALLVNANLSGADLVDAQLIFARLEGAKLNKATLVRADLRHTFLNSADLSEAFLFKADLSGARLIDSNLSGANFMHSKFYRTHYEPKLNSLPYIQWIALAYDLSELIYDTNAHSLIELRNEFKVYGLRKQEREITYAIKHNQRQDLWNNKDGTLINKLESVVQLIFFELTCAYGMKPARCFLILIFLMLLFSIFYIEAILSKGEDGIWIVWISDRVRKDLGEDQPVRLVCTGISADMFESVNSKLPIQAYCDIGLFSVPGLIEGARRFSDG